MLVENSFALSTHLIKNDLLKARKREPAEGYLNIADAYNKATVADYRIEYAGEETYLIIYFGVEQQRILLAEQELTFGTRTYLTCGCRSRTNKLYLNEGVFACRKCHKLQYQSTTINRSSKHGRFLYQESQRLKIMAEREKMSRIFWRSRYSKNFVRWLRLCDRAGLKREVEDAINLMSAINSQD